MYPKDDWEQKLLLHTCRASIIGCGTRLTTRMPGLLGRLRYALLPSDALDALLLGATGHAC